MFSDCEILIISTDPETTWKPSNSSKFIFLGNREAILQTYANRKVGKSSFIFALL
jgi:hypothetical protein